jgi:AraC-like DNA-binding protein
MLASCGLILWKTLESYGLDSHALFVKAGLDPERFRDPDARFSFSAIRNLWKLSLEATWDPCLGIRAARYWHPSNFHAAGFAWMASASLKDALERTVRYFRIVSTDPERLSLVETDDDFRFIIDTADVRERGLDEEYDLLMAIIVDMCRTSYGPTFKPLLVMMERPAPPCAKEFVEYFGAPVQFSSETNLLAFDKEDLTKQLPTANAELAHANERIVMEYLSYLDRSDIITRVKTRLIDSLPSGRVTEESIADALHLSRRSLQRRLKEEGTSYTQVLDETRRQLAAQYVRHSRLSINEITYLLGFSEPSNFSRAFRRWTGASPTAYREST